MNIRSILDASDALACPTRSPNDVPLDYPSTIEPLALWVTPPLPGLATVSLPATSHSDALAMLSGVVDDPWLIGTGGEAAWLGSTVALKLIAERETYQTSLAILHQLWLKSGEQLTPEVVQLFSSTRSELRALMRSTSIMPPIYYSALDWWQGRDPRKYADAIARAAELPPNSAAQRAALEKIIRGVFKDNAVISNAALMSKKTAAVLSKAGPYLFAVPVAHATYKAFRAETPEEMDAAMKALMNASVQILPAALCVALTVSTAGWGALACGMLAIPAGIYMGKAAESLVPQLAAPAPVLP